MAELILRETFRFSDFLLIHPFHSFFFQERDDNSRGVTLRAAQNRKGLYHLMNETINPGILSKHQAVMEDSIEKTKID